MVVVVVVDNRGRGEVWSRGGVEGLVHGVVAPCKVLRVQTFWRRYWWAQQRSLI